MTNTLALAIQGGGAHGAFAWGVLDRLLEDGVTPSALSGVSSGAIMAVMVAQGWARNGATGARENLQKLWTRIGQAHAMPPGMAEWDALWGGGDLLWQGVEPAMRLFSPSQLNPMGLNPLRDLLRDLVDRDWLNHKDAPPVSVAATDVETGQAVIFDNAAVDVDILLASSCLPFVFPAVEIGGRGYWDGAYATNPPLRPLLSPAPPAEIVLICAQPMRRPGIPKTASEIFHRVNELAFLTTLQTEVALVPPSTRLSIYEADEALAHLPAYTKIKAGEVMIANLFAEGRKAVAK
jgi:NTE family protein